VTAVRFDAAAVTDVALARDWYDGERPGLGEELVDAVAAATDRIGRFPSAGSLVHAGLRRHFLDRFPYVLYYRTDPSGVLIIACLHVARGPEHQVDRLRG